MSTANDSVLFTITFNRKGYGKTNVSFGATELGGSAGLKSSKYTATAVEEIDLGTAPATKYTVKFVDWNGAVLKTEVVEEGASATAPANPTRPSDADYEYTFEKWDTDFTNVTSNLTVTAVYTKTPIGYAKLYFGHSINGDEVTVDVKLDKIPSDITALASATINYIYDSAKLEYVKTESTTSNDPVFNRGSIAWSAASAADYIDTAKLTENGNVLFKITFKKKGYGKTEVSFAFTELGGSNGIATSMYTATDVEEIDLGTNTLFKVEIYYGTANSPSNLKGTIENIPANTKITQAQIDEKIGDINNYRSSGYTNSDGEIHYIYPELWYNNGGKWELFDLDTPITSDLKLCLLNSVISLFAENDRTIKGHSIPDFSLEVPYSSETAIGESVLDGLTLAGKRIKNMLEMLKVSEGIDAYEEVLERLRNKGIIDDDNNILNKTVSLKISDFLTADKIEAEVDKYLNDNINDDEFIASILKNDSIVNSILGNDDVKISFMQNSTLWNSFLDDEDFIKELLDNADMVNDVIKSAEFKESFINNDDLLDYILTDPDLKTTVLGDSDFLELLANESTKFVIDVYFEGTETSPAVYNYITSMLADNAFKTELKNIPELKELVKDKLKVLIKTDVNVRDDVFDAIRANDSLKNTIIESIRNDETIKTSIRNAIRTNTEIKDSIKTAVKDDTQIRDSIKVKAKESLKTNDSFKTKLKTWVSGNIETDISLRNDIKVNMLGSDIKYDLMRDAGVDEDLINKYKNDYSSLTAEQIEEIDNKIDEYFDNNVVTAVTTYFDKYYTSYFNDMYDSQFDNFYSDNELFDEAFNVFVNDDDNFKEAFDKYIENNDNFKKAFDKYIEDNANLENAFSSFVNDETHFNTFYDDYVADASHFDELFDRYYDGNTEEMVKSAYSDPALKPTVEKYIKEYVEDMIDDYLNDNLSDDLKAVVDDIMETDIPDFIRDSYNNDAAIKDKIDTLIENNALKVINDYKNNALSSAEKDIINKAIKDYANKTAESYINGTIDKTTKDFIDDAIDNYVKTVIRKFIDDENDARAKYHDFIVDNAQKAIDAYKNTQAYKDLIDGFKKGNKNIEITKDNVVMVRGIASAVSAYTFDRINDEFLIPKFGKTYTKLIDLLGKDYVEGYVNAARDSFVDGLNAECDKLDTDVANGIDDSVYTYPAALSTPVNYVGDVLYHFYDKAMVKVKNKVQNTASFKYSENTYLQKLLDRNILDDVLFNGDISLASGNKSGYKLKDEIMDYYDGALKDLILAHDAMVWYGTLSDSEINLMLTRLAEITAKYANKVNDIVMDYIDNGKLPGGLTLDRILGINQKIEDLYNQYEDEINKLLDKYEEYLNRDYSGLPSHIDAEISDGENLFTVYKIILETADPAFSVDSAYKAVFDADNFAKYPKAQKVVDKIKSYKYTPAESNYRYNIDSYKATLSSRTFRGIETGNITIDVSRYLAR